MEKSAKGRGSRKQPPFCKGHDPKVVVIASLYVSWLELSLMTRPGYKGLWEMEFLLGSVIKRKKGRMDPGLTAT